MNKTLIFGISFLILVLAIMWILAPEKESADTLAIEEAGSIAEKWILDNSPTYTFDGFELKLEEKEELVPGSIYRFLFSFKSRAGGYGDRTDQFVSQVITDHTMEVIIEGGEVITALTDGIYSEIDDEMISEPFPQTMTFNLFFGREGEGETLHAVERTMRATRIEEAVREVIISLIEGPSTEDEIRGYYSLINPDTEMLDIYVRNMTVYVDFSEDLQEGVAGSATVMFIRQQIEETLKQFPEIESVVISIEGRVDDILQP